MYMSIDSYIQQKTGEHVTVRDWFFPLPLAKIAIGRTII